MSILNSNFSSLPVSRLPTSSALIHSSIVRFGPVVAPCFLGTPHFPSEDHRDGTPPIRFCNPFHVPSRGLGFLGAASKQTLYERADAWLTFGFLEMVGVSELRLQSRGIYLHKERESKEYIDLDMSFPPSYTIYHIRH